MKSSIRNILVVLFKPTVYFIESDKFLGDFVVRVSNYTLSHNMVKFTNCSGDEKKVHFDDLYFFKRNAKKEASKDIIPVNVSNLRLINEIESTGIQLTAYARQQIIEDGEASEIYQSLLAK